MPNRTFLFFPLVVPLFPRGGILSPRHIVGMWWGCGWRLLPPLPPSLSVPLYASLKCSFNRGTLSHFNCAGDGSCRLENSLGCCINFFFFGSYLHFCNIFLQHSDCAGDGSCRLENSWAFALIFLAVSCIFATFSVVCYW